MKKMMLIAVAAIAGTQVNAQLSIQPEVGLNIANMSNSIDGDKLSTSSITGFKAGALLNIGIAKGFYIEPGAFYSMKGASGEILGFTSKTTINYLEVPLNLGYRYDIGNAGALFVSAGPYIGFGLSGKTKTENVPILGTVEDDIEFGDGADEMKSIDYGVNFSLGYISPIGIYLRAQYGLGLANLSNITNTSSKNRVFGISVGYAFQLN
jgi:hypothetical protein